MGVDLAVTSPKNDRIVDEQAIRFGVKFGARTLAAHALPCK